VQRRGDAEVLCVLASTLAAQISGSYLRAMRSNQQRNPAMRNAREAQDIDRQLLWLKRWIWGYFWLLIFEGVLRKWVFPPLSGPLLVIRDPVAVIIYIQAYRCGKFSLSTMWPFAIATLVMVPLAIAQIVIGVNTIPIALYGLRSYLLHLPLAVVMAETLTREDLLKLGRWLLLLAVPMTALMVAQFYAPALSWLNAGAGEGAGQIGASGGHVRPAATFSYGAGTYCYLMLVAAFVLYSLARPRLYPRWLLWPAAIITIADIPLSGGRSNAFTLAIMVIFFLAAGVSSMARFAVFIRVFTFLLLVGLVASQLPFFSDAAGSFSQRWEDASRSEGDVQEVLSLRVLGSFQSAFESAETAPLLGKGIGMGSNFASVLISGKASFMLAEGEWERVVLEFGPIFGLAFMGMRVWVAIYLVLQAMHSLRRKDMLAWLLVPVAVPVLLMAIMEQPTFQGFMAFGVGVCLAAARVSRTSKTHPVYA